MNDKLKQLKSLVRRFLKKIRYVPLRAVDCDQFAVEELCAKLRDATKPKRRKKAKT